MWTAKQLSETKAFGRVPNKARIYNAAPNTRTSTLNDQKAGGAEPVLESISWRWIIIFFFLNFYSA
jgi:hypothetical protein